jgi:hypothetical protein
MKQFTSKLLRAWLLLALLSPILVYIATSTYGPGVTGDSLRYLSTAQNIRTGLGVVDYSLNPLLAWPPLYSLILTTGPDVYLFGWALNILLYAVNIYLAGKLAATLLPEFAPAPALVALAALASPSILRLHTSIAPDPLFLAIILAFLILAAHWQATMEPKTLGVMLGLAACAGLVKYPGLSLALVGGMIIALRQWPKHPLRALGTGGLFTALAALPLAGWVFLHNFLQYGSMFGERGSGLPIENLTITLEKMLYWFLPYSIVGQTGPFLLLIVLALLSLILFQPAVWKKLFRKLITPEFLPTSLFFLIYFLMMIFLVSYAEHKDYRVDRLHILLFIPLTIILLALFIQAEPTWKPRIAPDRMAVISLLALLWLAYPLNNTIKYMRASLENGEIAGNLYNTRALNQSDIVGYLRANPLPGDATLYSNHEGAAWFFTRRNALSMPQGQVSDKDNVDLPTTLASYLSWPSAPGYIIWFDLDFKRHILHPDNLTSLAEIEPIFIGEQGAIYRVEP